MIKREEIKRLIQSQGLKNTVEYVWQLNCATVPKLSTNSKEGEDCRFGVAEHIIHRFFDSQTAKDLPNGAFKTFCERLHASEQDIATALERTRQDLETEEVPEADVATTLIWLWFIEAGKQYGIYDIELKFLLYTVTYMCIDDAELKQKGLGCLVQRVKADPPLLFRLLRCKSRKMR